MTDVVKILHNNTHAEKGSDNVMSQCFGTSLRREGNVRLGGSLGTVFWWLALARRRFTGRVCWWELSGCVFVARFGKKAVCVGGSLD